MPAGQKKVTDVTTDGYVSSRDCWELNSGPLEEQAVLLTAEPSLQSYFLFICLRLGLAMYMVALNLGSSCLK